MARVAWPSGETIVHREIWRGVPWCACPVVVVEDTPELLVTYLPEEAPFAFPPSADGRPHPWHGKRSWHGHGVLTLRRPREAYSVMHFWNGPERSFDRWYLNLEEPFRRTSIGYDTQDLELDVWIAVDGSWRFKDEEPLTERVVDGRYTDGQAAATRALGRTIGAMLDRGVHWWGTEWVDFEPDPTWRGRAFPDGWEQADVSPSPAPAEYVSLA